MPASLPGLCHFSYMSFRVTESYETRLYQYSYSYWNLRHYIHVLYTVDRVIFAHKSIRLFKSFYFVASAHRMCSAIGWCSMLKKVNFFILVIIRYQRKFISDKISWSTVIGADFF
jgi:hypothetical protein